MGVEEVSEVAKILKALSDLGSDDEAEASVLCDRLNSELAKGMAEKLLCLRRQGYSILVLKAKDAKSPELKVAGLRALATLLDKNCDPFDPECYEVLNRVFLAAKSEPGAASAALDVVLSCCVLHETNRQNMVANGLLDRLDDLVDANPVQVCRIWQALVQDDDVRAVAGKAHDNARTIVEDHRGLHVITSLVKKGANRSR